jgi:hypothetical protein
MIAFFPEILPDELLYSAFARYALMAGYPGQRDAHLDLFGSARGAAVIELPDRLDDFLARLPRGHGYSAVQLIEEHTTLPYYRCVLSEARHARLVAAMRGSEATTTSKSMLATGATSVAHPGHLQFCRACAEEDGRRPGASPAWRRVHQLPGVFVCPWHGEPLWRSDQARYPRPQALRFEPLTAAGRARAHPITPPHAPAGALTYLAVGTRWLLAAQHTVGGRELLQRALGRAVLLTGAVKIARSRRAAHLDVAALHDALEDRFGRALLEAVGARVDELAVPSRSWLALLLRRPHTASAHARGTHPLRVLLAAAALGMTIEELFDIAGWSEDAFDAAVRARRAARSAATTFPGRSPGKRLGNDPEWNERLRALAADPSRSLGTVARALGVHPATVKQRARRLGIARPEWMPTGRPAGAEEGTHRPARPRRTLHHHREVLLKVIRDHPTCGRSELRERAQAAFRALNVADPEWLERHLPPRRQGRTGGRQVDWATRDASICRALPGVLQALAADPGAPQRTSTLIWSRLGNRRSALEASRLPRTAAAVVQAAESPAAFYERRFAAAVRDLQAAGQRVSRNQIKVRSGLTSATARRRADYTKALDAVTAGLGLS